MNRKQESVYVTYIYPLQFVVHENERIDFSIEDINNLTYDIRYFIELLGQLQTVLMVGILNI